MTENFHEIRNVTDFLAVLATALFIFGVWITYILMFIGSLKTDPSISYFLLMVVLPTTFLLIGAKYRELISGFEKILVGVVK